MSSVCKLNPVKEVEDSSFTFDGGISVLSPDSFEEDE